jgi:redox-sensitive bicupin YhaK (pirin superfamily)
VIKGKTQFAKARDLALFSNDGDSILIENPSSSEPLDVLVIGGRPLNEPVARYGPFVMNTRTELMQAFEDYRNGRMGKI